MFQHWLGIDDIDLQNQTRDPVCQSLSVTTHLPYCSTTLWYSGRSGSSFSARVVTTCSRRSCGCAQPAILRSAGVTTKLKHTNPLTGFPVGVKSKAKRGQKQGEKGPSGCSQASAGCTQARPAAPAVGVLCMMRFASSNLLLGPGQHNSGTGPHRKASSDTTGGLLVISAPSVHVGW
jgi:hypothetical protein